MAIVTGLGGVFLQVEDPASLATWYSQHLGVAFRGEGDHRYTAFMWRHVEAPHAVGSSVFSILKGPVRDYRDHVVINLRVDDLNALAEQWKADGVADLEVEHHEGQGFFTRTKDPAGHILELWEDGFDYQAIAGLTPLS